MLRNQWQEMERRCDRSKVDLSAGFSDLRRARSDTLVREFVDKLKAKRDASPALSNKGNNGTGEKEKTDSVQQ